MQAKWLVGRCEWFCGARMHACIAALSQGIATAMIAYSDKSLGVFESVGSGDTVFDGRELEAKALLDGIVATVERRKALRERLARGRERVLARWRSQFEAIGQAILPAGM
jgi:polysaccharide pyruvyl transferase WcaK-like protein